MNVCLYVCMSLCLCMYARVSGVFRGLQVWTSVCMSVSVCNVYVCVCMCMCVYIYIYIYIYRVCVAVRARFSRINMGFFTDL